MQNFSDATYKNILDYMLSLVPDTYDKRDTSPILQLKIATDVTANPFSVTFESLDGLTVTGVWNADLARIEF